MAEQDPVLYETSGPVATITLNRPEARNAINALMRKGILEAVERAEADAAIRIVIIRGAGRGFCAGADIGEGVTNDTRKILEEGFRPFLMKIYGGSKIYIAQIQGPAAGIGAALAMACDLMVMAEDATIYMAFAAIALIPDGGATWQLARTLGYNRALETILEGKHLPAAECLSAGIANKVVGAGELQAITEAWAAKLATGAPLAQAAAKRVLRQVGGIGYEQAIRLEADEQHVLTRSADCREGVTAFFQKRRPVFRGE